jgi:TIR domain
MPSFFLSYAHSNELFVSRLAADFESIGCIVWKDCISTSPDLTFLERILSLKKRINFIILIFSESSASGTIAASDWNDAIIDEAIHNRNWIVPILVQDCNLPKYIFPESLEDFRSTLSYSSSFQKLLTRVNS